MPWSRRTLLAVAASVGAPGCSALSEPAGPSGTPALPPSTATYAYTHLQASGNRVVPGSGSVHDARPVDIDVRGTPAWLLAVGGSESRWVVVTADGTATTHRVSGGTSQTVAEHGRVSTPPLASVVDGTVGFVEHPADCAEYTHPVVLDGGLLYVAADGDVVVWREDATTRLDAGAPPDARPVAAADGQYALYGGRTDRYRHGALGDTTEGSRLLLVDPVAGRVDTDVALDAPAVFEGLSPLVADVDGDGTPELLTTVANANDGARLRAYGTDGRELATGPVYGPGWRHQLCVAPFGPDGTPEVAVVRKPHVDRTVEFYRLGGGDLTVTATIAGYASHTYGSRTLDGGLAADLDGDGRTELLVPTTDRRHLDAVRRTADGARAAWSLPLDGRLVTNVAGVALEDGVAVGAGTEDAVRVWQG